jgi:hypothetical protein
MLGITKLCHRAKALVLTLINILSVFPATLTPPLAAKKAV